MQLPRRAHLPTLQWLLQLHLESSRASNTHRAPPWRRCNALCTQLQDVSQTQVMLVEAGWNGCAQWLTQPKHSTSTAELTCVMRSLFMHARPCNVLYSQDILYCQILHHPFCSLEAKLGHVVDIPFVT